MLEMSLFGFYAGVEDALADVQNKARCVDLKFFFSKLSLFK